LFSTFNTQNKYTYIYIYIYRGTVASRRQVARGEAETAISFTRNIVLIDYRISITTESIKF